jgi:hypothetical protein
MIETSFHSYTPAQGHGLPHDPFNAIVAPRPIGWISSRSAGGQVNLAPYSFFNAFNYVPPIIGFSSIGRKDTLRNVQETGEFVWNLVSWPLAVQGGNAFFNGRMGAKQFAHSSSNAHGRHALGQFAGMQATQTGQCIDHRLLATHQLGRTGIGTELALAARTRPR